MKRHCMVVCLSAVLAGLAVPAPAGVQDASLLKRPLFPVHLRGDKLPVTQALAQIGSAVKNEYVLFGIEVQLSKEGAEPSVNLDLPPGSTLGDALREVLGQLGGYEFEVVSPHLVNVHPRGAKKGPGNVLNTQVRRFDVVKQPPGDILSRPKDFIPELKTRLSSGATTGRPSGSIGPGLRSTGPTVTLHLRDVSVREILNAVSVATEQFPGDHSPMGWVYAFRPDPTLPTGGQHTWIFHWSAPRGWKKEAGKPKQPVP